VSSTNVLGTGYGSTVYIGESITYLDQFRVSGVTGTQGELLANDAPGTAFAVVKVGTGSGFVEVGETPITINGVYGTLTVNETGHYTYTPSSTMPHSTVNLVDSFTYQIVQPNGVSATATLSVTINVGTGTTSSLMAIEEANMQGDEAVAAASEDTHHLVGARSEPVATDTHDPAADRAVPAEATGLPDAAADADHADGTVSDDVLGELAYQMFEGQGVLENVLSAYLDRQPLPAAADPRSTVDSGPGSVDLTPVDMPQDPLGYLSTSDDIEKHNVNNGHVI